MISRITQSRGEGSQPDGITVYGRNLDSEDFPTFRRGRAPLPGQNVNSLERRKEALKTFLAYCRQNKLKVEFWDVHFCQGSSKNLSTNEKNKAKKYRDAFRAFMDREDAEFGAARDDMMFLNETRQGAPWVSLFGMCLSGALSEGAWKIINRLAKIKFPTPPCGHNNPPGCLSYLVARSRWADWWLGIIMRTMFDTNYHKRARPTLTNSSHCIENRAGSHLEDEVTATSKATPIKTPRKSLRQLMMRNKNNYIEHVKEYTGKINYIKQR